MSELKAQAEALRNGFLQSLGESYDIVNPDEFPVAEAMLINYGLPLMCIIYGLTLLYYVGMSDDRD
jgi:hypothetical protein